MDVQIHRVSENTVTVVFPNGTCRPATDLEVELITELETMSA